jgi:phosphatidylglycerophosphate synthase
MPRSADAQDDFKRELSDRLADPLNRVYRYPAARALLPLALKLTVTPSQVTLFHTATGVGAAALIALGGGAPSLIIAFVLLEVRSILDCLDGVIARARNMASARGRALDELGDAIAFIALAFGITARVYRDSPELPLAALILLAVFLIMTGSFAAQAHDYFKRMLSAALLEGRDVIADEIAEKRALVRGGRGGALARFGLFFDEWQVRFFEPRGVDRVRSITARADHPSMRRLISAVALLSWENAIALVHIGVLSGMLLESQVLAMVYGISALAVTLWLSRPVLLGASS